MEKTLGTHTEVSVNNVENGNAVAANPAVLPAAPPKKERHKYGKHKPLTAERIFDISAYGIWNYVIQVGTSVVAAKWFMQDGGKKYFDKASQWMGENVISKVTKLKGAQAAQECRTPLIFAALITVGNFFIPPLQYAEKHKAKIVSWINDNLNAWHTAHGNPPDEQELKDQQEAIRDIAAEPLQNWKTLWGGRALGLTCNVLATLIVGDKRNAAMENAVADMTSNGFRRLGFKKLADSNRAREYTKIAFLDYGYSLISSNVIYLYSHYLNPPKYTNGHERHNGNGDHPPALMTHDAPEIASSLHPKSELKGHHHFVQLKPTNPELLNANGPQLAH